jgi:uncharacterized protein YjhX (UPF0386 family)
MRATEDESPAQATRHEEAQVTVHRSTSDRVVFVEQGNSDGWIATDLTLELRA